ncbi:MAG: hypothetical protein L0Z68_03375 [Gammaproteobacteria bacterium]|nr:hypothetical protein [Gammaproteobacteria bacterium]
MGSGANCGGLRCEPLVIGLTIVAVGTPLPELPSSVASALKGEPGIAIGNMIGSDMFNTLVVLGLPALIRPTEFGREVLTPDFPVMLGLTLAMYVMAHGFRGGWGELTGLPVLFWCFPFAPMSGYSINLLTT